ncbi:DUF512 domain-containing protein [Garciella nitratireducens]|uniref:DUF512 domain-containing protein n=1 Tax=Garciella nitratireducens TaxID=218205 RepID=UPI000DEA2E5D|nr:DUF512 domain-containing protein [Garciella nitratireducens]RBP39197.1 putative radical SAM enzyme (TIGR03279 family) [Garciella nitratireducens]
MDKILIKEVIKNSIAEEVGIVAGDFLISVNYSSIHDIVEYKYLITDEHLLLQIEKKNGDIWEVEIEKDYDEDLGLIFENAIIDKAKGCKNKCIFCFIDQLPRGLRNTLYFKDDDTRLSFLQGNYVTLTNLKKEEIERIIKYKISPINISVHTTNPDLRRKMLNNKNAGKIMDLISRFSKAKLTMNVQIVLCPDINDREELDKTLEDLLKFYPSIKSVTIVPVGITKYRQNLYPIREFTKKEAQIVLRQIKDIQNKMLKKYNTHFVFPGDEFFIKAEENFPEVDYYEGFGQLENGVGMISLFCSQFKDTINNFSQEPNPKEFSIVTGKLAFPFIKELMESLMKKWKQLNIHVYGIENEFFGEKITVSGLITGQDIIKQLKRKKLGEFILIPQSMLKAEDIIFLDDVTIDDIAHKLSVPVYPVKVDGKELIKKIFMM